MIDASVPAEVKNGVSAWEMNLRASSGGVRYVQVGTSFPYPLYCPIRDASMVKPDNHMLMKVLPSRAPPPRHKPVSEGDYFKSREVEFRKHMTKRFAHFQGTDDFFMVHGGKPPTLDHPIKEDTAVEAVTTHAPLPPLAPSKQAASTMMASQGADESSATAAPLTIVSRPSTAGSKHSATAAAAESGPVLVFSASQLLFLAPVNTTVHASLRVENAGSTVVFYSWIAHPNEQLLPGAAEGQPAGKGANGGGGGSNSFFWLADVANGVLLPENDRFMTFTFRAPHAGVFTQQYELLTVPAGRERITVSLRAVVLGGDGDVLATAALERRLQSGMARLEASAAVSELLHLAPRSTQTDDDDHDGPFHRQLRVVEVEGASSNNKTTTSAPLVAMGVSADPFVMSSLTSNLKKEVTREIHDVNAMRALHEAEQQAFEERNPRVHPTLQVSYNVDVVARMSQLWRNVVEYNDCLGHPFRLTAATASQQAPPTTATPPPGGSPPTPTPSPAMSGTTVAGKPSTSVDASWNLSLRTLTELPAGIRDVAVRNTVMNSVSALVRLAKVADPRQPEEPLSSLLWRQSGYSAFGDAADAIHGYASVARDMVDARGTNGGGGAGGGAGGKGGKDALGGKGGGAADKAKASGAVAAKGKGAAKPTDAVKAPLEGEQKAEYDAYFFAGARRIVTDAISEMLSSRQRTTGLLDVAAGSLPLVSLVERRTDGGLAKVRAQPHVEKELEPLVDTNAKAKKK